MYFYIDAHHKMYYNLYMKKSELPIKGRRETKTRPVVVRTYPSYLIKLRNHKVDVTHLLSETLRLAVEALEKKK